MPPADAPSAFPARTAIWWWRENSPAPRTDPVTHAVTDVDLGFVGEPDKINTEVVKTLINSALIPVVAPVGVGPKGETYNINADTVAGAVAGAIAAERLILLTDVAGVLDREGKLIPKLNVAEARALIANGTISRRHDPQDRDGDRRDRGRRQGRGHPGRPHPACASSGTLHRTRRGTLIEA